MSVGFDEKIKKRIENDISVFETSFYDLSSVISRGNKGAQDGADTKKAAKRAIEEIIEYLGGKVVSLPEDITDINEQLEYLLKPTGIMRRRVGLKDSWWKQTTGALLGRTVGGEVVALMPRFLSGYKFTDPASGKVVVVNKKTEKLLQDEAFCFYRPFPAKKLGLYDLALYIWKSITNTDIAFVIGTSLLVTLLGMLLPFINKQIFDSVIPSGTKHDIFPMAGLLLGAALAAAFFNITKSIILTRLGDKINMSVQSAAMNRILSLQAAFFKDYSSGELANRLSGIEDLCKILSETVVVSGLSTAFSLLYIFQMHNYAPALVVPGMAVIFSMLAFTILLSFIQQRITNRRIRISAKISGLVYQLFSGIQKIKLAGAEKRAFAKWASAYKEEGLLNYSPPIFLRMQNSFTIALSMGGSLLLYYSAGTAKISASDYIAFIAAYGAVSGALLQLAGIVTIIASVKPLMQMVEPVLKAVPEVDENKTIVRNLSGNIEINNMTFRYTKDGPTILNNISLKIRQGEYVAIVGKTGCGKSTLMRLLLGFEKPESGAIYFDGQDLESLDVRSVRRNIGVVLQNGKLFSGDIYSNIVISAPWLTLEDAWEIARLAGLEEDIKSMPMGMHTMISEGSGGISGGQRQRLMIARAIAPKPKIILFDEATSALDNITQKIVSDSVGSLNCTRIVIAHRLSTIKNCDRVILLNKGEIAEQGTFEELIQKRGLFYELASRQMA